MDIIEKKRRLNISRKLWRLRNPEKERQIRRNWKAHNKDKIAVYDRRYRLKNKERAAAYMRRWRELQGEKGRERGRTYSKTLTFRYHSYKSRAKRKGFYFHLTLAEFKDILNSNAVCYYCGAKNKLGLDRMDSYKGYDVKNVVPACWPCNNYKKRVYSDKFIKLCISVANYHRSI